MTVQIDLWQLLLAALIPTLAVIFNSGKAHQRLKDLEEEMGELKLLRHNVGKIEQKVSAIQADIVWIRDRLKQ